MGDASNVVTLTFPAGPLEVDLSTFDGTDWRDMKRATGLHDMQIVVDAVEWGDRDATAALAWVLFRRDDPELTFDAVLHSTHYGAAPGVDDDEIEVADPPPVEAPFPAEPFADIEERMAEALATSFT